jgi:hypothetical protein
MRLAMTGNGDLMQNRQSFIYIHQRKIDLINGLNPEWQDLYDDL